MNLFEHATKNKLRFPSQKGSLTVEDLWDLPLTSKSNVSLDKVAKMVHGELKSFEEGSFVEAPSSETTELELHLNIIKYIIAVRLEERKAAEDRNLKAARKQELLKVLEQKRNEATSNLSEEAILKELENL